MIGQRFHFWTVCAPAEKPESVRRPARYWLCRCDCGTERILAGTELRAGRTKSCGCYQLSGDPYRSHGYFGHPLYNTFFQMRARCYNERSQNYLHWGARGIRICDEWLQDPISFIRWAEQNGWRPGLTLDREDNDGDYKPSNCRFVTWKVQANNKRSNVIVTIDGVTMTLKQAAELFGVDYTRLHLYARTKGLPIQEAIERAGA